MIFVLTYRQELHEQSHVVRSFNSILVNLQKFIQASVNDPLLKYLKLNINIIHQTMSRLINHPLLLIFMYQN